MKWSLHSHCAINVSLFRFHPFSALNHRKYLVKPVHVWVTNFRIRIDYFQFFSSHSSVGTDRCIGIYHELESHRHRRDGRTGLREVEHRRCNRRGTCFIRECISLQIRNRIVAVASPFCLRINLKWRIVLLIRKALYNVLFSWSIWFGSVWSSHRWARTYGCACLQDNRGTFWTARYLWLFFVFW